MLWQAPFLAALSAALPALVVAGDSREGSLQRARSEPTKLACRLFQQIFPGQTFFSNSSEYANQNEDYYSASSWLGPACVVQPSNVAEMSYVIKAVSMLGTKFAVRGGGHMPIADAANIGSAGVLISTSGLNTLELSDDKSTLAVGAGNNWADVQRFLKPEGLVAVGGRVGLVGVPGYTLGGGISFYGNQHGFTSSNIVSYECVLAGGEVVTASETSHPDLFWALRGGGNSFAIVTTFTMRVFKSPSVWVGTAQYAPTSKNAWLNGVYNFARKTDAKAAAIPLMAPITNTSSAIYAMTRFYDDPVTGANASVWKDFTAPRLTPTADSYSKRHISDYLDQEVDPQVAPAHGLRTKFHVFSSTVDRDALQIAHDALLSHASKAWSAIPGLYVNMAIQPITKHFIEQSGDIPQGIDAAGGPYFWYCLSLIWYSESSDAAVEAFVAAIDSEINTKFTEKNLQGGYLYMNDASADQPIFQRYPPQNLARLKEIREKYDPSNVLTDQMPGGWKVAKAQSFTLEPASN